MERLINGFEYFRQHVFPQQRELFKKLAEGRRPGVMFITCADWRVMPELIFNAQPGELFVYRNIGNIVPPYAQPVSELVAAIEYAVNVLEVDDIVVCGHSDCSAMKALRRPESLRGMPSVAAWLKHADVARCVVERSSAGLPEEQCLWRLTCENVIGQLEHLRTLPVVAAALAGGHLGIHGWVYDIAHADLQAFDPRLGRFVHIGARGNGLSDVRPHLHDVVAASSAD
ncbi:MAG TPA: carbonic anhydrase [Dyella sp.]|uniref:carbonic anhydrase n=1 Tax=Dyella sp. TaxID=1869338 RepID=UPI002C6D18FE|nr:carbonic anhydrase [Dyella sp.]HTV84342.1 carbonic anhydrase [Dyella sp.]